MAKSRFNARIRLIWFALPAVAIFAYFGSSFKTSTATWLQTAIFPIQSVAFNIQTLASGLWGRYVFLMNVEQENIALRERIQFLELRQMRFDELEREILRLRSELGLTRYLAAEWVYGFVVGRTSDLAFHSLRLNRGKKDGIKQGNPVLSSKGVVGKVLRVGDHFCDIQLLHDINFSLDVFVERTRTRGVLKGYDGRRAQLQLSRQENIKLNDSIVTSGLTGGFPPGIPVGWVSKIHFSSDQVSQSVYIEPWVDTNTIRELAVLKVFPAELQRIEDGKREGELQMSAGDDL